MNNNIQTILFDLDGTLLNTNELIIQSFMHTFDHYGLSFTLDEIITFNGPPLPETFQKIDKDRAEEMIKTYRQHNLQHHDELVTAFPHVIETIQELHENNFSLGVVTTKMNQSVQKGLSLTGLKPFFKTVITFDDVKHLKPDPEPVLKAMGELDAEPETTLMIGDNSHDILAGQRAGVQTAGVAWAQRGAEYLEQYKPTYMLNDMKELLDIVLVHK